MLRKLITRSNKGKTQKPERGGTRNNKKKRERIEVPSIKSNKNKQTHISHKKVIVD
jgi:hypothetical protein